MLKHVDSGILITPCCHMFCLSASSLCTTTGRSLVQRKTAEICFAIKPLDPDTFGQGGKQVQMCLHVTQRYGCRSSLA